MAVKKTYPRRAQLHEIYERSDGLEARMDARFDSFNARMDARFERIEAKIEQLASSVHRIGVLVEEQNARNNIVLDGLTNLFDRQERHEERTSALEKHLLSLK